MNLVVRETVLVAVPGVGSSGEHKGTGASGEESNYDALYHR